jgi:hypothetical protein
MSTQISTSSKRIASGLGDTVLGVGQLALATATLPIRTLKKSMNITERIVEPLIDTSIIGKLKQQASAIDKVPSFYKITFLILFYVFFYKIIFDMGIFFGVNTLDLVVYMAWFGLLLLFLSFIRSNRSRLYN